MPYLPKEEITRKRKLLKKALPEYKLSVRWMNYSKISVSIMEGPVDLVPDTDDKYVQINEFQIDRKYDKFPEKKRVLSIIRDIANEGNYIASVDGDYGNIPSFYIDINIGKWDKDFVVKVKK